MKRMKLHLSKILIITLILIGVTSSFCWADTPISIEYFYSETCTSCQKITKLIDSEDYSNYDVKYINIRENKDYFEEITEEKNVVKKVPMIISKDNVYVGYEDIKDFLTTGKINDEKTNFSLIAIALAGLIDGINPCAISMLILLLSILINTSNEKKILKIGIVFSVTTFIIYFLIGTGLLKSLVYLSVLDNVAKIIYSLIIVFCLYMAYLNLKDFIHVKKGKLEKVKTQLSKKHRHKARDIIRKHFNSNKLYLSTFIVAVLVSLIDFLCTGGIYLPSITFMLSNNPTDLMVYLYLALYNFMFILPILTVTVLVYFKKSIFEASELLTDNLKYVKILGVLFYMIVAFYMINILF